MVMKRNLILCVILLLVMMSFHRLYAETPPGQIAVSPGMFELNIGTKPVTQSIRLKNLKTTPVSIKVDVYNWTLDDQNKLKVIPPNPQSLDQWMVINPVSFSIDAGKEQVIRFSIRPRLSPTPGEHRAIIYFTEQSQAINPEQSEMLFKLGVGVYGYTDPVRHAAILHVLAYDRASGTLRVEIQNDGNVHTRFKGDYAVWKKGTFPGFKAMSSYLHLPKDQKYPDELISVGNMNNTPVLAGNRRTLMTKVVVPDDKTPYVIAVQGTIDGKTIEKIFQ